MNPVEVKVAYDQLIETVTSHFDQKMARTVEACASVVATLMLQDLSNPVGLILVDNPSTGKTTALSMFYDLPIAYRSDSFTPSAFVSHATNVAKKKLGEIDLLPRIKHKGLIVPEMAPIFGQKREDLQKSIAILTRVFDGEGYTSDSGSHGRRGYQGDFLFAMLAATTPLSKTVWDTMGQFGSRLLFLTPAYSTEINDRLRRAHCDVFRKGRISFKQKVSDCSTMVNGLFSSLYPEDSKQPFPRSIEWNVEDDPAELKEHISIIAEFTARCRSKVAVWESRSNNSEGGKDFAQPLLEGPQRLATILYALGRSHALVSGNRQLSESDIPLIIEVALSSMPNDRRQVIDLLLSAPFTLKPSPAGVVTSSEITDCLKISRPSAIKVIDELALLGIGHKRLGIGNQPVSLELDAAFNFLLSEAFSDYRRIWRPEPEETA